MRPRLDFAGEFRATAPDVACAGQRQRGFNEAPARFRRGRAALPRRKRRAATMARASMRPRLDFAGEEMRTDFQGTYAPPHDERRFNEAPARFRRGRVHVLPSSDARTASLKASMRPRLDFAGEFRRDPPPRWPKPRESGLQ